MASVMDILLGKAAPPASPSSTYYKATYSKEPLTPQQEKGVRIGALVAAYESKGYKGAYWTAERAAKVGLPFKSKKSQEYWVEYGPDKWAATYGRGITPAEDKPKPVDRGYRAPPPDKYKISAPEAWLPAGAVKGRGPALTSLREAKSRAQELTRKGGRAVVYEYYTGGPKTGERKYMVWYQEAGYKTSKQIEKKGAKRVKLFGKGKEKIEPVYWTGTDAPPESWYEIDPAWARKESLTTAAKKAPATMKMKTVATPVYGPVKTPARKTTTAPALETMTGPMMATASRIPVYDTSKSNAETIAQRYREQGYIAQVQKQDNNKYRVVLTEAAKPDLSALKTMTASEMAVMSGAYSKGDGKTYIDNLSLQEAASRGTALKQMGYDVSTQRKGLTYTLVFYKKTPTVPRPTPVGTAVAPTAAMVEPPKVPLIAPEKAKTPVIYGPPTYLRSRQSDKFYPDPINPEKQEGRYWEERKIEISKWRTLAGMETDIGKKPYTKAESQYILTGVWKGDTKYYKPKFVGELGTYTMDPEIAKDISEVEPLEYKTKYGYMPKDPDYNKMETRLLSQKAQVGRFQSQAIDQLVEVRYILKQQRATKKQIAESPADAVWIIDGVEYGKADALAIVNENIKTNEVAEKELIKYYKTGQQQKADIVGMSELVSKYKTGGYEIDITDEGFEPKPPKAKKVVKAKGLETQVHALSIREFFGLPTFITGTVSAITGDPKYLEVNIERLSEMAIRSTRQKGESALDYTGRFWTSWDQIEGFWIPVATMGIGAAYTGLSRGAQSAYQVGKTGLTVAGTGKLFAFGAKHAKGVTYLGKGMLGATLVGAGLSRAQIIYTAIERPEALPMVAGKMGATWAMAYAGFKTGRAVYMAGQPYQPVPIGKHDLKLESDMIQFSSKEPIIKPIHEVPGASIYGFKDQPALLLTKGGYIYSGKVGLSGFSYTPQPKLSASYLGMGIKSPTSAQYIGAGQFIYTPGGKVTVSVGKTWFTQPTRGGLFGLGKGTMTQYIPFKGTGMTIGTTPYGDKIVFTVAKFGVGKAATPAAGYSLVKATGKTTTLIEPRTYKISGGETWTEYTTAPYKIFKSTGAHKYFMRDPATGKPMKVYGIDMNKIFLREQPYKLMKPGPGDFLGSDMIKMESGKTIIPVDVPKGVKPISTPVTGKPSIGISTDVSATGAMTQLVGQGAAQSFGQATVAMAQPTPVTTMPLQTATTVPMATQADFFVPRSRVSYIPSVSTVAQPIDQKAVTFTSFTQRLSPLQRTALDNRVETAPIYEQGIRQFGKQVPVLKPAVIQESIMETVLEPVMTMPLQTATTVPMATQKVGTELLMEPVMQTQPIREPKIEQMIKPAGQEMFQTQVIKTTPLLKPAVIQESIMETVFEPVMTIPPIITTIPPIITETPPPVIPDERKTGPDPFGRVRRGGPGLITPPRGRRKDKGILSDLLSVQKSQAWFGTATHPRATKKEFAMGRKTMFMDVPTMELREGRPRKPFYKVFGNIQNKKIKFTSKPKKRRKKDDFIY
jgi:hypothetical protein